MISDVLHAAVLRIDEYLADDSYSGDIRGRIVAVRDQMDAVRVELDTPPFDLVRDGEDDSAA